ncbi:putative multi antimicrobial extrusion protein [Dioscorea sansibarensis]
MIPQLFAYALNFPIQKFLQAQSKVTVMAFVSALALLFHIFLSWLLLVVFKLGLVGAAASLNLAWVVVVLGQFVYIAMGYCPDAWNGFSLGAFSNLVAFARLSIASGIMMCLEMWFYTVLVALVGQLPNPKVAVAAMSICINLLGWQLMVFFGFNACQSVCLKLLLFSVRISNELGAGRPRAAKFSIIVVILSSFVIGLMFFIAIFALRDVYGVPFTNSFELCMLSLTLLLSWLSVSSSTVSAVGAGWQWLVAYINLGCYYVFGLPLGFLLAVHFDLGVKGMWSGMLGRSWFADIGSYWYYNEH